VSAQANEYDVIVLGAGAAGMMCAAVAGSGGARVALLERAERPGKKILISGGGRCNFTNLHCRPDNFLSQNPHFAKSALARYTPRDFLALVERHGIAWHEKTLGQLFCDGSAWQIVTMMVTECRNAGVETLLNTETTSVARDQDFVVKFNTPQCPQQVRAPALVIATGGLSIPKMGATAFGYDIARQFGIKMVDRRPALVPLLFSEDDNQRFTGLAGISAEAVVTANANSFREKLLFTHRGLSGPAILQASSYWQPGGPVAIDLAPGRELTAPMRANPAGRNASVLAHALRSVFPRRLADRWIDLHMPADGTNRSLEKFEHSLHHWQLFPAGTEGYAKAEVTAGGVDTAELSAQTMEAKRVPGLFFIGEVVDVTGHLGGFNFQWAWASAAAAGRALAAR
jgi:predicted Rossmann fold flavoprotein